MRGWRFLGVGLIGLLVGTLVVWQAAPVQGQDTVSAQLRMEISILNRLLVGIRTITATFDQNYTQLFSSGTGANNANALWQDERTLGASASEDLDLNGSLTDDFGASVTCTKLKALVVHADSGNTNDVDVGGANTSIVGLFGAINDIVSVRPGGTLIYTAPDANGVTVTATTGDLLSVTNSAGSTSITYDVIVLCVE